MDYDKMPTALVTGASGFMGAHVIRALLAQGCCEPVGLDDLSGGFEGNLPEGVPLIRGSVTDALFVRELFCRYQFKYVFHLAAYAAEGLSHFIRRFNYTNNVLGAVTLINEAIIHEVDCFVFTSSIAVYGAGDPPFREDMVVRPEDPYGIAKLAVELDLMAAHRMWGLRYVIFRPHNVYGEYQNLGDPYRNVIGIFMNRIMMDEPLAIFGDGTQQRAFTYIGDIAPLIAEAPWIPAAQNQVFNIGNDTPCTINDLAWETAQAMGVPDHPIIHLPPREEVQVAFCDHSKAQEVFGRTATTLLSDGLAKMAGWAKRTGTRTSKLFENIEVTRNLPATWRALVKNV
jgi:UDP-glucose 4-epimerase